MIWDVIKMKPPLSGKRPGFQAPMIFVEELVFELGYRYRIYDGDVS